VAWAGLGRRRHVMRTSKRISINAVTSWVANIVSAAMGLVIVPFLLATVGKEGYGLCSLAAAIVSLTVSVDLGLQFALSRHIAAHMARQDTARVNELFTTSLAILMSVAAISAGACFVLARPLVSAFNIPESLAGEGVFMIRWYAGVSIPLAFVAVACRSALAGRNRFDVLNGIRGVFAVLQGVAILAILALTKWGIYGWALAMLASQAGNLLAAGYAVRRFCPEVRVRPGFFKPEAMRELMSLGGLVFLLQLCGLVSVHADPIILSCLLGPVAVALYAPSFALFRAAGPLVSVLTQQLHPLATSYHVAGRKEQLRELLIQGTKYTMLLGVPVSVILGVLSEPIIKLWLGRQLGQGYLITARVLAVWAVIQLFSYAIGSQWPVLLGMAKLKFLAYVRVPLSLLNILASIICVKYTSLGVLGVVVPTVVISAVRRVIVCVHVARAVDLPVASYFRQAYLRPLVVLVGLSAAAVGLKAALRPESLPVLLAVTTAILLVWFGLLWSVGLSVADRKRVAGLLRHFAERIAGRWRADEMCQGEDTQVTEEPREIAPGMVCVRSAGDDTESLYASADAAGQDVDSLIRSAKP